VTLRVWGSALTFQRKYEEAEEKFRRAEKFAPRSAALAPLYNSWGILERQRRRLDMAAKLFKKSIHLDRRYVYAWQNLGCRGLPRLLLHFFQRRYFSR
jgi:tetratricopeptide (TPR) repeat protein